MKMKNIRLSTVLMIAVILILPFGMTSASSAENSAKQASNEPIVAQAASLIPVTEDIRGLDFLYDLPVELVSQDRIKEIIAEQLEMEISAQDDMAYSSLYSFLGLMPRGSSMLEDYQTMAEEQVAGLYDPYGKKFYVVDIDLSQLISQMLGDVGPLGGFLSGLLEGMGSGITDALTGSIIIHELTHALDDQHFDIESRMNSFADGNSSDAQLAYQSLLEGNATRVMNEYTYQMMGLDSSMLGGLTGSNMMFAEQMMDYNPFLERIMLVPYLQGEAFVNEIINNGANAALNHAFDNPPSSMEQILHPEKYIGTRDNPSNATTPDLSSVLPGWHHEATDTLGELIIALMFELYNNDKALADRIAAGWDYDVITSWRSQSNDLAIAWVTVWDSPTEAQEFFDEYLKLLEKKYPGGSYDERESDSVSSSFMDYSAAINIEGRVVTIVEGVPKNRLNSCVEAVWPEKIEYN